MAYYRRAGTIPPKLASEDPGYAWTWAGRGPVA
jgi:hypothetical protein